MRHAGTLTLTAALTVLVNLPVSTQVLKSADLQKVYGSRWIPLPIPDSRIAPGAIVTIKKGQVAWESSLDKCGAPKDVMTPKSGNDSAIDAKVESQYGAEAALKIGGVSVGPNFKRAKTSTLKLQNHHPEGLDRITLGEWFNSQGTKLSSTCQKFLAQKDVFLVQEAYRVDKGVVTLYDDTGAKLAIGGLNIGIVKLDASANATKVVNDTLEFTSPMYTAIRRLKYMKDGELQTLSAPGAETTRDADVKAILDGSAK